MAPTFKNFAQLSAVLGINIQKSQQKQLVYQNLIDTYACYSSPDIKNALNSYITSQNFKNIVLDTMKLYEIYDALRLTIQEELGIKQYYNVRSIMKIIIQGRFYRFMTMKTMQVKILTNNRTTAINIKTIISGLLAFVSKRLNLKQISQALMIYQLQEALHKTSPFGIYLELQKIIETFQKMERVIKNQKYKAWLQKVKNQTKQSQFAQPYHFLYLVSLSQKKSSKSHQLFKIRNKSQYVNGSFSKKVVKFFDNFTQSVNQKKVNFQLGHSKVKGLSFSYSKEKQNIQSSESGFQFMKKSMIKIHPKRSKSVAISEKASSSLKKDFKQNNFTLCFKLLEQTYKKKKKKCHARLKRVSQIKIHKVKRQKQFTSFYKKQLVDSLNDDPLKVKNYQNSPFGYNYKGMSQQYELEGEETDQLYI